MRIAITGASGLVGSALVKQLTAEHHEVWTMVRSMTDQATADKNILWDPIKGNFDAQHLEGIEAVIHLAGKNIGAGRWTKEVRQEIWDSRVQGTQHLVHALGTLRNPPKVLVSASAVGYYGDRGSDLLKEDSAPGSSYLARLCVAWEEAALQARSLGIRVVIPRLGTVITPAGGALARLLAPFRLGLGGPIASGASWMSWISLEDLLGLLTWMVSQELLSGPVNAVSPNPVTNREFARELARALHRPAFIPLPEWAIKAVFGEMGRELLLTSLRVVPTRLVDAGCAFQHRTIAAAFSYYFG